MKCWVCFDKGVVIKNTSMIGKIIVPCPACEDRKLIDDHLQRERKKKSLPKSKSHANDHNGEQHAEDRNQTR